MPKKHVVIDPIHGKIGLPQWLFRIQDQPAIRRMMGIKQLGLKSFIDFPGAIHTRYMHCLGTMFLAGKLCDLLIEKEPAGTTGRPGLDENLRNNKNCLMAAGFFHDIGHGPFSHVMDFILKKEFKLSHEKITTQVVKFFSKELEGDSIPCKQVNKIIMKKHEYPFLSSIINGPLDVDKVDYVLRDSYHVGLRYSFDLDHFFDQIVVLGDEDELKKCELGLEKSPEALACAELFLLLWKSMYTLVYLVKSSRIAEKMLEKAVIVALDNGNSIRDDLKDVKKYVDLDESKLLTKLTEGKGFPEEICDRVIKTAELYEEIYVDDSGLLDPELNDKFLKDLVASEDFVSDRISQSLSKQEQEPYSIICDVIKSKTPKSIHLNQKDEDGEPFELKEKSKVIEAISDPQVILKVYADPKIKRKNLTEEKKIKRELQHIIEGW
jgi:HD superfamily phosphohydrolase